MAANPRTLVICCGAVAEDIVFLIRDNDWDHMDIQCLPADLHNDPEAIPEAVRAEIRAARPDYGDVVVLYGDCGTGGALDRVLEEEGVERISGAHCYEVFTGSADFHALVKAEPGCFFVTDFLVRHFRRLVYQGLALDRFPNLRETYFGRYTKLVYLAQSDDAKLTRLARNAAESIGLAFERRFTGAGGFNDFLSSRETETRQRGAV
jgi:hypothetical protein